MSDQTERPMCAHLHVSWRTKQDGIFTRGWWECDSGCGARFLPGTYGMRRSHSSEAQLEAAKAREEAGPRPQVRQFADLMEARLKANDHKGGWRGERLPYLLRRLREETDELYEAMGPSLDWKMISETVGREAADVANFAMMIADICGALAASEPPGGRFVDDRTSVTGERWEPPGEGP